MAGDGASPRQRITRTLDIEGVKQRMSCEKGKYELGEKLGKGTYGVVMRATDRSNGRDVAVKRISRKVLRKEGEAGEKRLYREVAIMGSLHHENLVNLIELVNREDLREMWVIIELVEGVELMYKIDQASVRRRGSVGGLSESAARNYFQQLVVGLNYVHSQGVVHRDLKPENILITHDDVCKITDFGLSNVQNTDTMGQVPPNMNMQTCCGTPYYVAPEVVSGRGYNGFTADVWSLGIILYVMLVGDLPFLANDLRTLLRKIGKGEYRIPEAVAVSTAAAALIKKILTPDEHARPVLKEVAEHTWFREGGFDYGRLEGDDVDESAVTLISNTLGGWARKAHTEAEDDEDDEEESLGKATLVSSPASTGSPLGSATSSRSSPTTTLSSTARPGAGGTRVDPYRAKFAAMVAAGGKKPSSGQAAE